MAWDYKGSKSLGAVCIGVALTVPALSASLADLLARIAEIQSRLLAYGNLVVSLPNPKDIAAAITAAAEQAITTIADIIKNIPGPIIEATVGLEADLAILIGLKATLEALILQLGGALSAGGFHVWSIDSTNASLAVDASAALSGGVPGAVVPGARVRGVLILTEDPGAGFAALSTLIAI